MLKILQIFTYCNELGHFIVRDDNIDLVLTYLRKYKNIELYNIDKSSANI